MKLDLSALLPLIGRWATTISMLHPEAMKGQQHRAVDTYRWLGGRDVVVHEVQARLAGGIVHSLEVYTRENGVIVSRNFDSGGSVSDYRASMTDAGWRVDGESERFASTSMTADVVEGLWRLKVDGSWVDWMTVRLERVAEAEGPAPSSLGEGPAR